MDSKIHDKIMLMQPDNNPYEFITNPEQPKKSLGPNLGGGKRQYIVFGLFVAVILVIVMVVVSVFFSSSGGGEKLITLKSYQIEIDRVLGLGQSKISSQAKKQQYATLKAVLLTDTNSTSSLISKRGVKPKPEQLAIKKDTSIDKKLDEAVGVGRFDEEYLKTVDGLVEDYYKDIKQAKIDAKTKTELSQLETMQNNIELIFQAEQ